MPKKLSLFIWNSNLTGCSVVYLATPSSSVFKACPYLVNSFLKERSGEQAQSAFCPICGYTLLVRKVRTPDGSQFSGMICGIWWALPDLWGFVCHVLYVWSCPSSPPHPPLCALALACLAPTPNFTFHFEAMCFLWGPFLDRVNMRRKHRPLHAHSILTFPTRDPAMALSLWGEHCVLPGHCCVLNNV